jgi:hypothetical protein
MPYFCYALVYWRKGSLEYRRPSGRARLLFVSLLVVQLVAQACGLLTIAFFGDPLFGVALTLYIWVPINAFSEQRIWVYIFDAVETRWTERRKRLLGGIVGVLLTLTFVGLIHALFWGKFLPGFSSISPWSEIFFASQFVITLGYLMLYRRTGSMRPLFYIHIIADITLVLGAQYSIIPSLWTL